MAAQSTVKVAEIPKNDAHIYNEGFLGGLIGALTVAAWFLIVDSFQGRPLLTPSILGSALFKGGAGLISLQTYPISFEMVLMFTWVHGMVFVAIGVACAWLLDLAERDPNYGIGILILFVILEFGFIGVRLIFADKVLQALAIPDILIGNLLAAGTMGAFFWKRHPHLEIHP